jgi:polar amino acid transport system permease protein
MAPSLAGQFVSLIKDSSLLSVIGLSELTLAAQEVDAFTDAAFESDLPLAAGSLAPTLPLSLWTRSLERRLRSDT